MKKITLFIISIYCLQGVAQVTNQGEPMSWKLDLPLDVPLITMPRVDVEEMQAEDVENDKRTDVPWRFGKELDVEFSMENAGKWETLENGDRVWRLQIFSEEAKTLNFIFNTYYMPPGASLYFYNDSRSDLLGAYTESLNREDQQLGTWFVEGEHIWVEYYEPKAHRGEGKLQFEKVVHGYRSVIESDSIAKGLNDSGPCNQDVDCPVGSGFDGMKDQLKRSVALFIVGNSVCSGSLINNTDNDNAPYFLTANHCDNGNPATWAFRFNWVSSNPSCGTTDNSGNGSSNQTTSGATKLASNTKSDFMLVNIDSDLPSSWNLVWAGWNRSQTDVPDFTVGIHHPTGDIMKVCIDYQSPNRTPLDFNGNPTAQMWRVNDWDLGVTEGGSSGSALFDQDGRIVGQLAGGAAACSGTTDNGQPDFYGRLDTSWDFGNGPASRLSDWLDPSGSGVEATDILDTPDYQYVGDLSIYPNPATTVININNNNSTKLNYSLYSVNGQKVQESTLPHANNAIPVEELAEGMYFLKLYDPVSNSTLNKRILIRR